MTQTNKVFKERLKMLTKKMHNMPNELAKRINYNTKNYSY